MPEETKTEFYSRIPLFMHHFPHLFVWQQQQLHAREQQQQAAEAKTSVDAMREHFASAEGAAQVL